MMVGFHGHDNTTDPEEFATPESFAAAMALSRFHGVNLDIGHFVAAGYDPIAYIREHHDRITNLHIKDRRKNHGPNMPFGQGDTPIAASDEPRGPPGRGRRGRSDRPPAARRV